MTASSLPGIMWFRDNVCNKAGDDSYYPFLSGEPEGFREVHGCFINMTMNTDQFAMWRAVLEAVAGAYAVGDLKDIEAKLHEGLTETGRYTPGDKLILPDIPFKV